MPGEVAIIEWMHHCYSSSYFFLHSWMIKIKRQRKTKKLLDKIYSSIEAQVIVVYQKGEVMQNFSCPSLPPDHLCSNCRISPQKMLSAAFEWPSKWSIKSRDLILWKGYAAKSRAGSNPNASKIIVPMMAYGIYSLHAIIPKIMLAY